MSSISIYVDTNCINARQNEKHLNKLEELYDREKILIEKTDTLDTELQEGDSYPKGLKKSLKYIESFGSAVLGHSRLNFCQLADEIDEKRLTRVLAILWGEKPRSVYSKNEIRDAMHIATAIRYGGTYFITEENALLNKATKIQKEFNIKIRKPKSCLVEVIERLKVLGKA